MDTFPPRPILVTGASSGIGLDLARTLAIQGHPVFATARRDDDLAVLGQIENVVPLRLDVRDPRQAREAVETVRQHGLGLYGLVNNAGIGELGLCATWTDEELRNIFEVNVFGPFRLTNVCLPLLVESSGRVVLVGSQGGMISKKYFGPYTMTKHALEAYSVALSEELAPYGVGVSIVQPGGVATEIGAKSFPGTRMKFERAEAPFEEEAAAVLSSFEQPPEAPGESAGESESNRKPSPPALVSAAVLEALFSAKPKLRYLVGTKWEGDRVIHALLEKLLDENDNPAHGYSLAELTALMAEKMEKRRADEGGGRGG
ncbi:MAG: SDR family NAD(P)-dependent oxidoreductase [Anaerolineales bacterium]|nr:SDR family NAD(P)-dependent oxidoreductase [Anaerolineales bacterium]